MKVCNTGQNFLLRPKFRLWPKFWEWPEFVVLSELCVWPDSANDQNFMNLEFHMAQILNFLA